MPQNTSFCSTSGVHSNPKCQFLLL